MTNFEMPIIDLYNDCGLCISGDLLFAQSKFFLANVAIAFKPKIMIIWGAVVALLIMWRGFEIIVKQKADASELIMEFFILIASGVAIQYLENLVIGIYDICIEILVGTALTIFELSDVHVQGTTLGSLLYGMNEAYKSAFGLIGNLQGSIGWLEVGKWVMLLLILLPILISYILFFSQIIIAMFRLMILVELVPFIILICTFKSFRGTAIKAIKTALGNCLTIFVSASVFSFLIVVLKSYGQTADGFVEFNSLTITSPKFIFMIVIPSAFVALMLTGVEMANSIFETSLSNTGTAIMAAGIAAPYLAAWKGTSGLGKTGAAVGYGVKEVTSSAVQSAKAITNKLTGANKPPTN